MAGSSKYKFSSFFAEGQYETQVERLEVLEKGKGISIGVPKVDTLDESRIALIPNSIRSITGYGHSVIIESGAGDNSYFSDDDFASSGAIISKNREEVWSAQVVINSSLASDDQIDLMPGEQILISPLQLPMVSVKYLQMLKEKRITAMAMEYLRYKDGSFPVMRIMSEIAGRLAILTASELLSNNKDGRGVLLGGVSGVPPAKIVVLGAGVVGEHAIRTALGLGASVRVFDNDIDKIIRLQNKISQQLHTSSINPEYLAYQLTSADVVIGAMHSKSGRAPILVTEEMVTSMKKRSVVVDVSIDQGGCFETSEMTTHHNPTFIKHGVIHYCVPNIASKVARTSSIAMSNVLIPLILKIGNNQKIKDVLYHNEGIRNGVYTYEGHVTNSYLAQRFGLKYAALELLLTSSM